MRTNTIIRANENHVRELAVLASQTFYESHGHSAPAQDIRNYVAEKFNLESIRKELQDPLNIYHLLFLKNSLAGFSKIILNHPFENAERSDLTKLERIYLLKEFYGGGGAQDLLNHNITLAKENNQSGTWLFVWKENERALRFYQKNGFVSIGSHDFKISATHSNPNHLMLLDHG